MLSLINDVLDLSAVEAKKKKREETEINLSELVNESLDIIKGYPDGDKKHILFMCRMTSFYGRRSGLFAKFN